MDRAFLPSPTLPSTKLPQATVRSVVTVCVSYAPIHSTIWTRVNNLAKRKLAALHDFSRFLVTFRRSAHYHSPFAGTQVSTAQAALCVCVCLEGNDREKTNKQP